MTEFLLVIVVIQLILIMEKIEDAASDICKAILDSGELDSRE